MTTRIAQPGENPLAPEKDPADRSILIGIGCTLLFHVMLVLLSPQLAFDKFSGIHTGINVRNANQGKTFDFELAQPPPVKEQPPFQFVETNPDAPANEPDKTNNFSNRNQQTAQPVPAKEKDPENRPSITNAQDKIKSDTAIVAGNMADPQPGAARAPDPTNTAETEQQEQKLRMEQAPLNGFDKTEGKAEDGMATNIAQSKSPTTKSDQNIEGVSGATDPDGALVAVIAAHKAQPKERPRLQTSAMPSVLTNRSSGSPNAGIIGRDARWSEYGEYLHELEAIIVAQWYLINDESRISPPHGSHVTITFKINSKGETDIVTVEDADSGKLGVWSCQSAIQKRQPYRKWTEQMIILLGDEQSLTFGFYYL